MPNHDAPESICKSIFQGGEQTTSVDKVTNMWINLINQIEASKQNRSV